MLKISLIAAAALVAAAAPAFAQDAVSDIVERNVSYADLDLSAPAGVAALDQRIDTAVTQVCGRADLHDLGAWKAMQQCRADARSKIEQTRNTLVASAKAQKAAKAVVLAAK
jgi:UrcA family protein